MPVILMEKHLRWLSLAFFKNLCYKIVRNALAYIVKLLEENVEPNKIRVSVKMCDGAQRDSPYIPFITANINIFSSNVQNQAPPLPVT
jgi:hypothetical protein